MSDTRTCSNCGASEDDAARLLAWATFTERGRTLDLCTACARTHLRSLEGKLDREYW